MNPETRQRGEEHDQEGTVTKKLPMQVLVNIVVMFMLAFLSPTGARDRTIAPMVSRAISSTLLVGVRDVTKDVLAGVVLYPLLLPDRLSFLSGFRNIYTRTYPGQ